VGLSAGGLFRFQAHPHLGIYSYKEWLTVLKQPGSRLVDEYGKTVRLQDFKALVTSLRDEALASGKAEYRNAPELPEGQRYIAGERYRDAEGFLINDYEFA